ncbi:lysophospholipid acyltransferase family protein [Uliginosibacterium sp. sgz301328]|uniref:lysophospholipid acyltransferase family protein n=1 Tax=Uliginosibacterium sp. sgz301328 TaxID=3243764 RepID=UPI00359E48F8
MAEMSLATDQPDSLGTRLFRCWRVLATGICFASFGLGGLLLWLVVFPILNLVVRNRARRARIARDIIRLTWRMFIGQMHVLGIYTYEFIGEEKLRRNGQLILANHPSLIDVVFLVSHVRNADCVVKGPLARNPFTRGPVRAADFICNDSGEGLIDDCIASLRRGHNLIIFPEGTRTRPGEPMQLQRGAANIAVRGRRTMTPIVIQCDQPMLFKGQKWWRVPRRRPHYVFRVEDDIAVEDITDVSAGEARAARVVTDYLRDYFTTRAGAAAAALSALALSLALASSPSITEFARHAGA